MQSLLISKRVPQISHFHPKEQLATFVSENAIRRVVGDLPKKVKQRTVVDGTMFVFVDDSLHGEKLASLGCCIPLDIFQDGVCRSLEFPRQHSVHDVCFVRKQLISLIVAVDGVMFKHVLAQRFKGKLAASANKMGFKGVVVNVLLRKPKRLLFLNRDAARCVNRHWQRNRKICRQGGSELHFQPSAKLQDVFCGVFHDECFLVRAE